METKPARPSKPFKDMHDFSVKAALTSQPALFGTWIQEIVGTPAKPEQRYVAEAETFATGFLLERNEDDPEHPGHLMRPEVEALRPNLLAAIGALICGVKIGDLEKCSGLSWSHLRVFAQTDKKGYGALFQAALDERELRRHERYKDTLDERIENGTEKPYIIRKGKDNDEIVQVATKSDQLLAKAIDRVDAKENAAAMAAASAASSPSVTNIGTMYNIQVPSFLASAISGPSKPEILTNPE